MNMTPTKCRACGADIVWAPTVNGKRMPLDWPATDKGNVQLINGVAHVYAQTPIFAPEGDLWMPHFATCPKWGK